MRGVLASFVLGLVGCDAPEVPPCARAWEESTLGDASRSLGTTLDGDAGDLHVELLAPEHAGSDATWPIAVVIHGAWDAAGTPVGPGGVSLDVSRGMLALHLDLPGGGKSDGFDDRRGPGARAAVATALRYAAGELADQDGCTVAEREPGADPSLVVLVGLSNGGNLAVATLADAELDVPAVSGLVTWETPSFPQAVNVELGNDPSVYEPGSCALDGGGVACAFDASLALADAPAVCLDLDADRRCSAGPDILVLGARDPAAGKAAVSLPLRQALGPDPIELFDSAEESAAFWSERDSTALAEALVAAQPDLPVLLVASEEDHVLRWPDHPHVVGWLAALQAAGVAWSRINPGTDWVPAAGENAPGQAFGLGGAPPRYLSEDEEAPLGATLAGAVEELAERTREGSW